MYSMVKVPALVGVSTVRSLFLSYIYIQQNCLFTNTNIIIIIINFWNHFFIYWFMTVDLSLYCNCGDESNPCQPQTDKPTDHRLLRRRSTDKHVICSVYSTKAFHHFGYNTLTRHPACKNKTNPTMKPYSSSLIKFRFTLSICSNNITIH